MPRSSCCPAPAARPRRASAAASRHAREPGADRAARVRRPRARTGPMPSCGSSSPLVPAAGDRFVLRQIAPPDTIGGGVVIDPAPRKHGPGAARVGAPAAAGERRGRWRGWRPSWPARRRGWRTGTPRRAARAAARRPAGAVASAGSDRRYFAPAQLERARERAARRAGAARRRPDRQPRRARATRRGFGAGGAGAAGRTRRERSGAAPRRRASRPRGSARPDDPPEPRTAGRAGGRLPRAARTGGARRRDRA